MNKASFVTKMVRELLLISGQFALFYILMNFSNDGLGFFTNTGHVALFAFLILQTMILVQFGQRPLIRLFGSLIVPLIYTIIEIKEGWYFVFNAAHIWFWIFSITTGSMQALILISKKQKIKLALEFALTVVNVGSFLLLYFYFDTMKTIDDAIRSGTRNIPIPQAELTIGAIGAWLPAFLSDPTHIYIIIGGAFLALSLGVGRTDILRLKERINTLFGQYVDGEIRDRIISSGKVTSQKAELCILFADIRDFTSISETHEADTITGMLNQYFTLWWQTINQHGGIVDKFIGDAVMAVFGLRSNRSPCDDAVASFIDMKALLPDLNSKLKTLGLPEIQNFGVGIHFGQVVLGDIGSNERKNYTVIGDTVNIASRLESATKVFKTSCVISQETYLLLCPNYQSQFQLLGSANLKGKSKAIKIFGYK